MCGISGIILKTNNQALLPQLFVMNKLQKHRGNDDEGYTFFSNNTFVECFGERTPEDVKNELPNLVHKHEFNQHTENPFLALSHNRLSILDISAKGHQPMSDESQKYWITYNGEVYNYSEIKANLLALGHQFKSNTDTEVILKAYIEYGPDCVKKFNGMWSFCIYDLTKNILFCSRDRFGVKPFYYRQTNDYLAFASEQKTLYNFPDEEASINKKAVFKYLSMGVVEDDAEGFTNEVLELKPGHNLTYNIESKSITTNNYYSLESNLAWKKHKPKNEQEYIGHC